MAQHLDLEEQEQLDQLKHFWKQYGNIISAVLIVVFGSIAAWNGWQYWQRSQALQAAAMFDEVERAAQSGDMAKLDRAFADMKDRFGGTTYAQQAGMLAAKTYFEKNNLESAKVALTWVAGKSSDEGYQAMARLRLAGLQIEAKAWADAQKTLSESFPREFEALAMDRRGDLYLAQGKRAEAKAEFEKAYKALDEKAEYRRLVEVKLNSLGVDPQAAVRATTGGAK